MPILYNTIVDKIIGANIHNRSKVNYLNLVTYLLLFYLLSSDIFMVRMDGHQNEVGQLGIIHYKCH